MCKSAYLHILLYRHILFYGIFSPVLTPGSIPGKEGRLNSLYFKEDSIKQTKLGSILVRIWKGLGLH